MVALVTCSQVLQGDVIGLFRSNKYDRCVTAKKTGLSRAAKGLTFYCKVIADHSFMDADRSHETFGSQIKDGLLLNCSSDQSYQHFCPGSQAPVPTR